MNILKDKLSNQLNNSNINLSELLDNISNGNYAIPKFQRGFVWKVSNIESLGDSMMRGAPIASLLFMPENSNLSLAYDALRAKGATTEGSSLKYVLDGQQRTTSIARIFLGMDDNRTYYFDIAAIVAAYIHSDFLTSKFFELNIDEERFCKAFASTKNPIVIRDMRFLNAETIRNGYSSNIGKIVDDFHNQGYFTDLQVKYDVIDFLNRMFGNLMTYDIPTTTISADADLRSVCRVFEKINTSGLKLTLFDLINAQSFRHNQHGLQAYLIDDIESIKNNAFKRFFMKNNEDKDYSNLKNVVYIIAHYDHIKNNKRIMPNNADILKTKPEHWFSQWHDLKDRMVTIVQWLTDSHILQLGLSNHSQWIIAYMLHYFDMYQTNDAFRQEIQDYCIAASLRKAPFTLDEVSRIYQLVDYAEALKIQHPQDKAPAKPSKRHGLDAITADDILDSSLNGDNGFIRAVKHIMYHRHFDDVGTHDICGTSLLDTAVQTQEHHLLPKAYNKGNQYKHTNTFANFARLSTSNNQDISDTHPDIYLQSIFDKVGEEHFKKLMAKNLIPFDGLPISWDDNFYHKRASMIADYLNRYLAH